MSFIKENTYFASYPYEVFLYLKYQQSTKSCACDKSHWQNILRVCQRVRERSHASPDMACIKEGYFNIFFVKTSVPVKNLSSCFCELMYGLLLFSLFSLSSVNFILHIYMCTFRITFDLYTNTWGFIDIFVYCIIGNYILN